MLSVNNSAIDIRVLRNTPHEGLVGVPGAHWGRGCLLLPKPRTGRVVLAFSSNEYNFGRRVGRDEQPVSR